MERMESMDDEGVCEGGVRDSDCSESVEPGVGAMNWTMVQTESGIGPRGRSFPYVRATAIPEAR